MKRQEMQAPNPLGEFQVDPGLQAGIDEVTGPA